MSKYRNVKTVIDGIKFDSKKEGNRYAELKIMQRAGLITDLQRQVRFELQPAFTHNGEKQRAIYYVADFVYWQNGKQIIEDAKGYKTREYMIKKKMMLYKGYEIQEV